MYLSLSVKLSILEGSFATVHLPEKSSFVVLRFCRYQYTSAQRLWRKGREFSVTPCSLYTDALSLFSLEAMKIREELGVFKSPVALSFLQHQLISSIVMEAKVI